MPPGSGEAEIRKGPSADSRGRTARRRSAGLHTDVAIAAGIIAFGVLVWGLTLTFEDVPAALTQGMGPSLFPRLVVGVLVVLAVVLAWTARRRPDPAREPLPRIVPLTAVAVLAFMAVLQALGFYAAILFATIGIGRLWGERRWGLLMAVGVGLVIAVHLVFVTAFGIQMPRGLIVTWLT